MATQDSTQESIVLLTKAYAQLLALAVHEFRTPVSVVGGYLRMLQRDSDSPLADRHRKMVEEAERSCARIVADVQCRWLRVHDEWHKSLSSGRRETSDWCIFFGNRSEQ